MFATLKLPCFSNKFHQLDRNLLCRWWSFYIQELLTISCLLIMTEFLVFWSPNEPESLLSACSLLASLFTRYKRKTSLKSVNTTDLTLGLFIETVSWGGLIPLLQKKNILIISINQEYTTTVFTFTWPNENSHTRMPS